MQITERNSPAGVILSGTPRRICVHWQVSQILRRAPLRMTGLASLLVLSVLCTTAHAATKSVTIKEGQYSPASITVKVGDTVVWTNSDERDHTVVADDGSFKSDNLGGGETFQFKFTKAGKFGYHCTYHPRMKGTVVVSE